MYPHILAWANDPSGLKETWFRPGLYSCLWVNNVEEGADQSVSFTWEYMWMELGGCNVVKRRILVEKTETGWCVGPKAFEAVGDAARVVCEGKWKRMERKALKGYEC